MMSSWRSGSLTSCTALSAQGATAAATATAATATASTKPSLRRSRRARDRRRAERAAACGRELPVLAEEVGFVRVAVLGLIVVLGSASQERERVPAPAHLYPGRCGR